MTTASPIDAALADLIARRELADATTLARRGHYGRATTALARARTTAAGLDLRARIAAQQGRYDEAATLWREAAEHLGEPGAFAAELAALDRLRSRRWERAARPMATALALALAAVVVGLAGRAGWLVSRRRAVPAGDR
jgi:hypothetical protein